MIALRRGLWKMLTDGVVTFAHSELQGAIGRRASRRGGTGNPSPPSGEVGCRPCEFHAHVAEAYLLLRRAADRAEMEGRIPAGVGGTIPVAKERLGEAGREVGELAASRPDLRADAIELQGHLASLTIDITGDVGPDGLPEFRDRAERCWELSHDLVLAYFEGAAVAAPAGEELLDDPLYQLLLRARGEDWDADRYNREVRELLAKEPSHA